MTRHKHYTLTLLADTHLVELKEWSKVRWGNELTRQYLTDIHKGAEHLAKNHANLRSRSELAAGTDLSLYPVREHYLVFHPIAKAHIVIVSILRQGRDIPSILRADYARISRDLNEVMQNTKLQEQLAKRYINAIP